MKAEANLMLKVSSLFSQILGGDLAYRLSETGYKTRYRASFKGLSFLDPVRGHALLSSGKGLHSIPLTKYC